MVKRLSQFSYAHFLFNSKNAVEFDMPLCYEIMERVLMVSIPQLKSALNLHLFAL